MYPLQGKFDAKVLWGGLPKFKPMLSFAVSRKLKQFRKQIPFLPKLYAVSMAFIVFSCTHTPNTHMNHLENSSSPYLLQHAQQPVDWFPWGDEALNQAVTQDKLIIISIGYSTCHWCHVMAHETFDDTAAARFMNENFISIKVDREERPDIDQVYMRAVQMMTGQGGWPLNVVALPDGRPIWGGTYFPKDKWLTSLQRILEVQNDDPESVLDYATKLQEGIGVSSTLVSSGEGPSIDEELFHVMRHNWSRRWDTIEGGPNKAPKFPLPNNYSYLLRYAHQFDDADALKQVERTLDAMAASGLYDQVGGGFTRYSTDSQWRIPHFEKMLYDNGQLLSLYADGYKIWQKEEYQNIILETAEFLNRELKSESGLYFSALDADTEGEEGKFYVWTTEEMQNALGDDADEFANIALWKGRALWENGNHVILRSANVPRHPKWSEWMQKLFTIRENRTKPGVDTKMLAAWNALTISGLSDAAMALKNESLALQAVELGTAFEKAFINDGDVWHAYGQEGGYIRGFHDDYALTIKAFMDLHKLTANTHWLELAQSLTASSIALFSDENGPFFWYTDDKSEQLISRSHETEDNVIPSSNAVMATNLFELGRAFGNNEWAERAVKMTTIALEEAERYPEGYSQWGQCALDIHGPFSEVVVYGEGAQQLLTDLNARYTPNIITIASESPTSLSPFENRYIEGETRIYVCEQQACQLPVSTVEEAVNLIKAN